MRKIGITLWVVAIILAAALSAILLRTNLLAGPPERPASAGSGSPAGSPPTTATAPTTAPARTPVSATTAPTTVPPDPAPPTTTPGDLYQALRSAAQQLMGSSNGRGTDGSGSHDFSAWYQRLEAAYGAPLPVDVAFGWFTQVFGDRGHSNGQAEGVEALACLSGAFPPRWCPAALGDGG